jgi:hypothetical protein
VGLRSCLERSFSAVFPPIFGRSFGGAAASATPTFENHLRVKGNPAKTLMARRRNRLVLYAVEAATDLSGKADLSELDGFCGV